MDLPESLKNDPHRKKLLQQILEAHDNAIISHEFDENGKGLASCGLHKTKLTKYYKNEYKRKSP